MQELFTGQYSILAWFILAIIVIYIPGMLFYFTLRQRRGLDFLRQYPDAAVVRIERSRMNGVLTVHDVDGEKPVAVSRGTHIYFYLTPGEHTLNLSYYWTKINLLAWLLRFYPGSSIRVQSGRNAKKLVIVKAQGKYVLNYDRDTERYFFSEDMQLT